MPLKAFVIACTVYTSEVLQRFVVRMCALVCHQPLTRLAAVLGRCKVLVSSCTCIGLLVSASSFDSNGMARAPPGPAWSRSRKSHGSAAQLLHATHAAGHGEPWAQVLVRRQVRMYCPDTNIQGRVCIKRLSFCYGSEPIPLYFSDL